MVSEIKAVDRDGNPVWTENGQKEELRNMQPLQDTAHGKRR